MQAQLPLIAANEKTKSSDCRWLEDLLRSRSGWLPAIEILHNVGRDADDTRKRQLREIAAASTWIISGQKGYKHLEHATAEEINHFCNWMESQAKAMTARAESLRRNAHKIFG